jgi:hypothetical protein
MARVRADLSSPIGIQGANRNGNVLEVSVAMHHGQQGRRRTGEASRELAPRNDANKVIEVNGFPVVVNRTGDCRPWLVQYRPMGNKLEGVF